MTTRDDSGETPRTDAQAQPQTNWSFRTELVPADLSRELETELASMTEDRDQCREAAEKKGVTISRDLAERILDRLETHIWQQETMKDAKELREALAASRVDPPPAS